MPDDFRSLLPSNGTLLERNIEQIAHNEISSLPVPLRNLWRIDNCPAELLPWLAWALSVDVWDDDWADEIKRNVIRNSASIHKHKGTLYAIELAIKSLGVEARITERKDSIDIERGKFRIDIDGVDKGIGSKESWGAFKKFISRSKRLSAHYDTFVNITSEFKINQISSVILAGKYEKEAVALVDAKTADLPLGLSSFTRIIDDSLPSTGFEVATNWGMSAFLSNHQKIGDTASNVNIFRNWSQEKIDSIPKDIELLAPTKSIFFAKAIDTRSISIDINATTPLISEASFFAKIKDESLPSAGWKAESYSGASVFLNNHRAVEFFKASVSVFSNPSTDELGFFPKQINSDTHLGINGLITIFENSTPIFKEKLILNSGISGFMINHSPILKKFSTTKIIRI